MVLSSILLPADSPDVAAYRYFLAVWPVAAVLPDSSVRLTLATCATWIDGIGSVHIQSVDGDGAVSAFWSGDIESVRTQW